jgi:serine/threonine protein kinase
LLEDLLVALQHAHGASVLHLDIKPANVLRDRTGGFVLTDFGISQGSRMFRGPLRAMGLGTPGYQAPEQRWGTPEDFDLRTDLYSLGATAWTVCVGTHLARKDAQHLLSRDKSETFGLPSLDGAKHNISQNLVDVIMSLLRQDPEQRPGSAAEALLTVRAARAGLDLAPSSTGRPATQDEIREVLEGLIDPLWSHIFKPDTGIALRYFEDGQPLAEEGESAFTCFVLLKGEVRVSRGGETLIHLGREGTFIGEIGTLTGHHRTASVIAAGPVFVYELNAAQLEQFVTSHPPVGVRLLRSMAERIVRETSR